MLMCFPFILIFISLLLIGFHSIKHFSIPFLRMTATPSWCWLSSLPLYNTVSPVLVLYLPEPVHLLSLIPRMCRLYLLISPVSYIVLTFQNPILVLVLVLKTSIFLSLVSLWLSPLTFIRVSCDDSGSPSHPVVLISSVAVSVTWVFIRNRDVSPMTDPQPGGPVGLRLEFSFS